MKPLTKVLKEIARRKSAREKPGEDGLHHIELTAAEWDTLKANRKVSLAGKFPDAQTIVLCGARITKL